LKARDKALELHFAASRSISDVSTASHVFGVGCSASLVSSSPKRGRHHAHICMASSDFIYNIHVDLNKSPAAASGMVRSRSEEDSIVSLLVLEAVAVGAAQLRGHVSVLPPETVGLDSSRELGDDLRSHLAACLQRVDTCSGSLQLPGEYTIPGDPAASADVVTRSVTPLNDVDGLLNQVVNRKLKSVLFMPTSGTDTDTATDADADLTAVGISARMQGFSDLSALPLHSFVYPGSFNPLHAGHVLLVDAALKYYKDHYTAHFQADYQASINGGLKAPTASAPSIPVIFEISAINADKPALEIGTLVKRLQQFVPLARGANAASLDLSTVGDNVAACIAANPEELLDSPCFANILANNNGVGRNVAVSITSEPFFTDKAKLFPGCIFLVGVDTLERLFNPKYYTRQSVIEMMLALHTITQVQRCRFIVGGRVITTTTTTTITLSSESQSQSVASFRTMEDVFDSVEKSLQQPIPTSIRSHFHGMPESYFRLDISSSEIRKKNVC
jgi:hypothetical protein